MKEIATGAVLVLDVFGMPAGSLATEAFDPLDGSRIAV